MCICMYIRTYVYVILKESELHHSIGSLIDGAHPGLKTNRDYLYLYLIRIRVLAVDCMPSLYPVRTSLSSLSLVLWELTIWSFPLGDPYPFSPGHVPSDNKAKGPFQCVGWERERWEGRRRGGGLLTWLLLPIHWSLSRAVQCIVWMQGEAGCFRTCLPNTVHTGSHCQPLL